MDTTPHITWLNYKKNLFIYGFNPTLCNSQIHGLKISLFKKNTTIVKGHSVLQQEIKYTVTFN
jgi:hypothetical protein